MKKVFLFFCFMCFFSQFSYSQSVLDTSVLTNEKIVTTVKEKSTLIKVVDWYLNNLNYYSITLLMTIESSFIPFPSEVVIPPAAYAACSPENSNLYVTHYKWLNIFIVILFGTLGALLGALFNYFLSLYLGRPIVYKFVDSKFGHLMLLNSKKIKKAEDYFVKNGNISTFIGRLVPGIRQLISIPAGLSKMKLPPFILYTCLGAGIWNTILALIGYIAHGEQDIINEYSHELSYVLLGVGVIFVCYLIYKGYKKKKSKKA
ncbi:MAG TPA: DedA family protein [Bacteroidales bacterium]|nr:DedA family protein [Bacteroidales bacterium]